MSVVADYANVTFTVDFPGAVLEAVAPAMAAKAEAIRADAEARTPVWNGPLSEGRKSGELRDGWEVVVERPGTWRVQNTVDYAWFVEFGGPHNPVPAGMLGAAVHNAGLLA